MLIHFLCMDKVSMHCKVCICCKAFGNVFFFFKCMCTCRLLDAVVVVGNGRLLRSWETTVGGLKWETVLDTGRLYIVFNSIAILVEI